MAHRPLYIIVQIPNPILWSGQSLMKRTSCAKNTSKSAQEAGESQISHKQVSESLLRVMTGTGRKTAFRTRWETKQDAAGRDCIFPTSFGTGRKKWHRKGAERDGGSFASISRDEMRRDRLQWTRAEIMTHADLYCEGWAIDVLLRTQCFWFTAVAITLIPCVRLEASEAYAPGTITLQCHITHTLELIDDRVWREWKWVFTSSGKGKVKKKTASIYSVYKIHMLKQHGEVTLLLCTYLDSYYFHQQHRGAFSAHPLID